MVVARVGRRNKPTASRAGVGWVWWVQVNRCHRTKIASFAYLVATLEGSTITCSICLNRTFLKSRVTLHFLCRRRRTVSKEGGWHCNESQRPYPIVLPWRQERRYQITLRWRKRVCCIVNESPQTCWSTSTVVCPSAVKLGIILHISLKALEHGFKKKERSLCDKLFFEMKQRIVWIVHESAKQIWPSFQESGWFNLNSKTPTHTYTHLRTHV